MPNKPELDALDKRLLNELQWDFPLVPRPFRALAESLGSAEDDILARVARLKAARVVRQISAIFDTRSLGYKSSLVAMRVPAARVDEALAAIVVDLGLAVELADEDEIDTFDPYEGDVRVWKS